MHMHAYTIWDSLTLSMSTRHAVAQFAIVTSNIVSIIVILVSHSTTDNHTNSNHMTLITSTMVVLMILD